MGGFWPPRDWSEHAAGVRNATVESFFPAADFWQPLRMPPGFGGLPLYAHLYTCSPADRFSTQGVIWTTGLPPRCC
jgi:hypothetical protein